jgi:hypothetical protein
MQEHVGKKGPEYGYPQLMQIIDPGEPDPVRYQPVIKQHVFRLPAVEHENLKKENHNIDCDQQPVHNRKTAGWNGIA